MTKCCWPIDNTGALSMLGSGSSRFATAICHSPTYGSQYTDFRFRATVVSSTIPFTHINRRPSVHSYRQIFCLSFFQSSWEEVLASLLGTQYTRVFCCCQHLSCCCKKMIYYLCFGGETEKGSLATPSHTFQEKSVLGG